MKLVAGVTISNYKKMQMEEDEIKDFVMNLLAREIGNEVIKNMKIEETEDLYNDTTRYSGTITLDNTIQPMYGITASGVSTNGSSITSTIKKTEEFRVAEYVNKNGNIARVELCSQPSH